LAFASWAAPVAAGTQGPPVNVEPPGFQGTLHAIEGETFVIAGETLVARNGKWEGEPSSFAYQWLHCHVIGARGGPVECTPIPGATSAQYSLTGSDLLWFVEVEVTATNASGSASAHSPLNAFVVAPDAILKAHPHKKTTSTHARFSFTANAPKATFECKMDRAQYKPCRSPFQANLRPGPHVFRVRAVGPGEARQNPAAIRAFHWQILRSAARG
jgi:hypothetical protein